MKFHGEKIREANVVWVVIPRPTKDIGFKCEAVLDFDQFEQLCPPPKAPTRMLPGGVQMPNFDDPGYKRTLENQGQLRYYYTILKSLEGTPGIEWEQVKLSEPKTWKLLEKELNDSGFNRFEVQRIIAGVLQANSLDERMLEAARENFLKALAEQKESSSQDQGTVTS